MAARGIVDRLGPGTTVASEVNGIRGLWVTLALDEDRYWVFIDRDPAARAFGTQWIGWAAVALLLSLIGAVLITRLINRPLAQLSRAAADLGSGRQPAPLPESGPVEIRTVNENFNRMVADLGKLEADRAVLLAGISHDLRTPLTRLRLEVEMANLPQDTRDAMVGDVEQIDSIVRQFLDYARKEPQAPAEDIELAPQLEAAVRRARIETKPLARVELRLAPAVTVRGYRTELDRALDNLLTNAVRYGRDPASGTLNVTVSLMRDDDLVIVGVADHGPGVPTDQIERLMRPFRARRSGAIGQRRSRTRPADRAAHRAHARRQSAPARERAARTARRTCPPRALTIRFSRRTAAPRPARQCLRRARRSRVSRWSCP